MISWSDESESAICEVVVYEVRTVITKPLVVMFFFGGFRPFPGFQHWGYAEKVGHLPGCMETRMCKVCTVCVYVCMYVLLQLPFLETSSCFSGIGRYS